MGAYAYCAKCDGRMDVPTLKEALLDEWACPACGTERKALRHDKSVALVSFEERLAALENKMEVLRPGWGTK